MLTRKHESKKATSIKKQHCKYTQTVGTKHRCQWSILKNQWTSLMILPGKKSTNFRNKFRFRTPISEESQFPTPLKFLAACNYLVLWLYEIQAKLQHWGKLNGSTWQQRTLYQIIECTFLPAIIWLQHLQQMQPLSLSLLPVSLHDHTWNSTCNSNKKFWERVMQCKQISVKNCESMLDNWP